MAEELDKKYANKVLPDLGLCICTFDFVNVGRWMWVAYVRTRAWVYEAGVCVCVHLCTRDPALVLQYVIVLGNSTDRTCLCTRRGRVDLPLGRRSPPQGRFPNDHVPSVRG